VVDIYNIARTNLIPFLIKDSQNILKRVASNFTVDNYLLNRTLIASSMHQTLDIEIYKKYFCYVPIFNLRTITLPSTVENSRIQLVVASQQTKTFDLLRQITLINKETDILAAQYAANQTISLQQADAIGSTLEQTALSQGQAIVYSAEADAWRTFTGALNFTSKNLATYVLINYMQNGATSADSLLVGFDDTSPFVVN